MGRGCRRHARRPLRQGRDGRLGDRDAAGARAGRGRCRHRLRHVRRPHQPHRRRPARRPSARFGRRSRRASRSASTPTTRPSTSTGCTGLPTAGWDRFWAAFAGLHGGVSSLQGRATRQMGTLGGGNHFIEVCLEQGGDDAGRVWLMLHSGSRNIGKELAERHIAVARGLPHNQDLPDRDLAVFVTGTPEMDAYRRDLTWAQEYAARNRAVMLALLCTVVRQAFAHVQFDGSDLVPPQLRGRGDLRRCRPAGDPQGRDPGRLRRSGHHPRVDGHGLVHRARPRQRGGVLLRVARRRPAHVPLEGAARRSRSRTWPSRPPASSAARTPAWSTRSRAPTRTWVR